MHRFLKIAMTSQPRRAFQKVFFFNPPKVTKNENEKASTKTARNSLVSTSWEARVDFLKSGDRDLQVRFQNWLFV